MFNLRSVFAFWAVVALFLGLAGRAQAQTPPTSMITVPNTGVKRNHQDYAGIVQVTQINYKDCFSEDYFTFTVNLGSNYAAYGLEVWAGTGCDVQTNRNAATATCWQLAAVQPTSIIVNDLKVTVRDMLRGRTGGNNFDNGGSSGGSGGTGGTGGTDATGGADSSGGASALGGGSGTDSIGGSAGGGGPPIVPPDAPLECTPSSAAVQPQTLSVYFLQLDSNSALGGQFVYKVTYKLNAPNPPSNVSADTGENISPVSWSPPDTSDQTIDGYQLYCDPAPGQAGLDEAMIVPDPGVLPVSCTKTDILIPNTRPADKYKCGTANKTSTHANATGLINNVAYNIAVASTDTFRNVGVISESDCGITQPVTGFFDAYRAAGGEGGGGFCSFSRHGRPVVLFGLFGLGLGLVLRRRRAT